MSAERPSIKQLKSRAWSLKKTLNDPATPHGHCLEAVAQTQGFRTWAALLEFYKQHRLP